MDGAADGAGIDTVARLRAYIEGSQLTVDSRLPPERELSRALGVSRAGLRQALAVLESEGQIWRHVGKGTFIGTRPIATVSDIDAMVRRTNPAEVMRTRMLIEPEVARLAALNATPAQIAEMRACMARSRAAATWRQYESWDNRLHRTIAEATQNALLVSLLDTLSAVRRAVAWGRLRVNKVKPEPDHHSFAEHEAIVAAIAERDRERAAETMRRHLETVERKLLGERRGA